MTTVLFAAAALAFYCLSEHRILSEEQLMLLLFIALPVGAFTLSGMGQDSSDTAIDGRRGTPPTAADAPPTRLRRRRALRAKGELFQCKILALHHQYFDLRFGRRPRL
ncbi:hypothetical protein ACFSTI_07715 [Rhizorhabdus histidinilytica]